MSFARKRQKMIYNKELDRVIKLQDCLSCEHFSRREKQCKGFGTCCFEMDELTNTILDPVTGLPIEINIKGEKNGNF